MGCSVVLEVFFQAEEVAFETGDFDAGAADAGFEALHGGAFGGGGELGVDYGAGLLVEFGDLLAADEVEAVELPAGGGEVAPVAFTGGLSPRPVATASWVRQRPMAS